MQENKRNTGAAAHTEPVDIELDVPAAVASEAKAFSGNAGQAVPGRTPKDTRTGEASVSKNDSSAVSVQVSVPKPIPMSVPVPETVQVSVPKSVPSAVQIPDRNALASSPSKEYVYDCEGSLVTRVRVIPWQSSYDYYRNFREQAEKYAGYVVKPGFIPENVPFFSYMPQYSQLDRKQFEFYIWLRCRVKEGEFPEADYSYIQLLIYEAINLSDLNSPEDTLDYLISIWCGYRSSYSRLDTQLADWICDFCLINRLKFPIDRISGFVKDVVRISGFKEYWFSADPGDGYLASVLINYCSNYDYRKSKFAVGENRRLYDTHMHGVLSCVLAGTDFSAADNADIFRIEKKKAMRDAYVGAVCVPSVRKRIEVEYYSVVHSYEFRFLISDLLRYTENRLRGMLGIKSKISVGNIPAEIREKADRYFEEQGIKKQPAVKKPETAEYEKYYDAEETGMSPERAREIESRSWSITEALVSDFSDDPNIMPADSATDENVAAKAQDMSDEGAKDGPNASDEGAKDSPNASDAGNSGETNTGACIPESADNSADIPSEPSDFDICEESGAPNEACDPFYSLFEAFSADMLEFVRAALAGDADGQKRASGRSGKMPDMLASEINAMSSDIFGDIILEKNGKYYKVIDDYSEDAGAYCAALRK